MHARPRENLVQTAPSLTGTGVVLGLVVPSHSCPLPFCPHAHMLPSARSASEKLLPADTVVHVLVPGITCTGSVAFVEDPVPSLPPNPSPHDHSFVPSVRTPSACVWTDCAFHGMSSEMRNRVAPGTEESSVTPLVAVNDAPPSMAIEPARPGEDRRRSRGQRDERRGGRGDRLRGPDGSHVASSSPREPAERHRS